MARGTLTPVLLAAVSGVLAVLPPPENVRIFSENLGLVLLWDPPTNTSSKLTYTTEYRGSSTTFSPVCVNQSRTSCDVTANISHFGSYHLHVRAEQQNQASDWVTTNLFVVDQMTNISAPSVKLLSRMGEMEVQISDPVMRRSHFQEIYQPVDYIITYWREGDTHKLTQKSDQSHVILPESQLTAHTSYCVQVHLHLRLHNKTSAPSNITCLTNSSNDRVPGWKIALVMLGSFLLVAMAAVLFFLVSWYSYRGIRYIHPKAMLPDHFFNKPPLSLVEQQAQGQPVESYHQLSIIKEAPELPLLAGGPHCSSAPPSPQQEEAQERRAAGETREEGEREGQNREGC